MKHERECEKMKKQRYAILDNLRGLILISMIAYHAVWDLVYIFDNDWQWYESDVAFLWQQSICWGFILLSGFCFPLGKHKLKRGLTVFLTGALVMVVTCLVMPENRVVFGVLTMLGSAMLLMIPLEKILNQCNPVIGLCVVFGLFIVTRNINKGALCFGPWEICRLPEAWYANLFTAYIGFKPRGFFSTDYFSLFPWVFLFMTGYFLHGIFTKYHLLERLQTKEIKGLGWMGKQSLLIYMLHQPVIYGVLFVIYRFIL